MRYLYTFLFYLFFPFICLRLLWRSLRGEKAYRQRLLERMGIYSFRYQQCLWVHAVSVGEVIASIPLIQSLRDHYPNLPMLVTTMTPTGAVRVKAAFGDDVRHAYLPYDLPIFMRRFLKTVKPVAAVMMETELWPNLFAALKKKNIPICLLNARLSKRSARRYRYVSSLARDMLSAVTLIAANSDKDAKRFIHLGARPECVHITGNIKFDVTIPDATLISGKMLRQQLGADRFVWIAASTHDGEEEIILAAHKQLREAFPTALLILVPRHQNRFQRVTDAVSQEFIIEKRSAESFTTNYSRIAVYIGDSMGELMLLYTASDVAFVGGSLIPRGGHNIVEPAALGKAIIVGPHMFNFTQMLGLFVAAKAIEQVSDVESLTAILKELASNQVLRFELQQHALKVVQANRGALAKQLELVNPVLKSNPSMSSRA